VPTEPDRVALTMKCRSMKAARSNTGDQYSAAVCRSENMHGLTIRVLGPLEVMVDGCPVNLTTGRLRTLLVALAMSAGKVVSIERLTEAVWSEHLPLNTRRSVQTYAGRLRAVLGGQWIEAQPGGFVLQNVANVDAVRFTRLLNQAGRVRDTEGERRLLDEALGLWRGQPFEGLDSRWLGETQAPRLVERHLAALERRIDLDIAGGRHGDLVAELYEYTARYPLRETLWLRLLVVLAQCGRQAEALERYEQIRARISDELGVDPHPDLQRVYQNLLMGCPSASTSWGANVESARSRAVPRQLPADVEAFVGRVTELNALTELAAARSAVTVTLTGSAGSGKTALAVHWARKVADRFGDGQLHLDMRGSYHEPTGPAEALEALLKALGTPSEGIPDSLDARVDLYHALTAERRILVVLDDARDAEHVRPLMPAGPECLAVITSRNPLKELGAGKPIYRIVLGEMPQTEARRLLLARLGSAGASLDPLKADAIVDLCGRMPRPLTVAAVRLGQQAAPRPLDLNTAREADAWRTEDRATLGTLLRTWRNRALLTQEQLAERTGLSARTIRRLEGDVSQRIRVASVRLLSEALDLDATERAALAAAGAAGAASREEDLARAGAGPVGEDPAAMVPRQLPADMATFVGRDRELAVLDAFDGGSATTVIAIDGMAGIGKTALAVHAAHRMAPRFQDGALFVDLHGYTRGRAPVDPGRGLGRFLRDLGMPSARIPQHIDDRAAVYRSLLAGRKILVVLDNAASEEQVRPLLPGTPGCAVLVTSRCRLAGLERTGTISLEGLSPSDSIALFVMSAGEARLTGTDPRLLNQVVKRCAQLPLAIYVAAARLRAHTCWTVQDLLERLDEQGQRLAELEAGERSVAAAFDLSYRELTGAEQRAYRQLSLYPGTDFDLHCAASLLTSGVVEARRIIDRLVSVHLLQEPAAGRYRFHDLIRDHAAKVSPAARRARRSDRRLK
jgi:DNA-binding SARP family transcriptional activator/transcriptional regulator with XRE-family HTH domain